MPSIGSEVIRINSSKDARTESHPKLTYIISRYMESSHLGISGDNGRFKITVGKEGMIWAAKKNPKYVNDEHTPIGNVIQIEGLDPAALKSTWILGNM